MSVKVIQKALNNLEEYDYYLKHLSIINQLLPVHLSNKELEVLAGFMHIKDRLGVDEYRFNQFVRKEVMEKLGLSNGGLSNHIRSMTDKGFIEKSDITKRLSIKPFLFPENKVQGYQIKITQKDG